MTTAPQAPHAARSLRALEIVPAILLILAGIAVFAGLAILAGIFLVGSYGWIKFILMGALAPIGLLILVIDLFQQGMIVPALGYAGLGAGLFCAGCMLLAYDAPGGRRWVGFGVAGALTALLACWAVPAIRAERAGEGVWHRWRSDLFAADVLESLLLESVSNSQPLWAADTTGMPDARWSLSPRGGRVLSQAAELHADVKARWESLSPVVRTRYRQSVDRALMALILTQTNGTVGWPNQAALDQFDDSLKKLVADAGPQTRAILSRAGERLDKTRPGHDPESLRRSLVQLDDGARAYARAYKDIFGLLMEDALGTTCDKLALIR